jgi:ABC-type maltose transport system permease subunit
MTSLASMTSKNKKMPVVFILSEFPGIRNLIGLYDLNSLNNLCGLNDLFSLISLKN